MEKKERELQKDLTHTQKDKESLFEKLKEMAGLICVDPAAYVKELQALKKSVMNQRIFINNIFRIFPTIGKLTLAETAALMMELDQFSVHHLVIHGEKFLTMIFRLSRMEEKVLTGNLDEGEVSLQQVLRPLEVEVTLPERKYGIEGMCDSFSPEILEKLSVLADLKDKQQKKADESLGMRDIAKVLAEQPKTDVEFPNIDDKRSISSRGSRPGTSGTRRVRSSHGKKNRSYSDDECSLFSLPHDLNISDNVSYASDITTDFDDLKTMKSDFDDERIRRSVTDSIDKDLDGKDISYDLPNRELNGSTVFQDSSSQKSAYGSKFSSPISPTAPAACC